MKNKRKRYQKAVLASQLKISGVKPIHRDFRKFHKQIGSSILKRNEHDRKTKAGRKRRSVFKYCGNRTNVYTQEELQRVYRICEKGNDLGKIRV